MLRLFILILLILTLIAGLFLTKNVSAAETTDIATLKVGLDTVWVLLAFFLVGYAFMFGDGNSFIGLSGFGLVGAKSGADVHLWSFWLFQAAFCGAAATIVAGGMAERMKFSAYLIYTVFISALVYPIIGHWIWGGGWLSQMGFADFAGSTVVHTVGGWSALIGTIGGVIVVFGVGLLDRLKIDDPVGAFPVHGMNGIWGTLSVGIFGQKALGLAGDGLIYGGGFKQLGIQTLGAASATIFAVAIMGLVFYVIKVTIGLRVSKEEEARGLDIGEHGMESYAGFQIFTTQ